MNAFKRKSMYAAVLAGLGAVGAAGTASAVYVNTDGLGQALIYPYYTVRSGNDTYLSVVNTTASTKAVKVRFLEGKNSREVLDFNLYLSPQDMWTAAVVATADGAKVVTSDKSCTTPAIPSGGQAFVNYAYTGNLADGETTSLDRTREGYFEIIEMGDITAASLTTGIKHVNGTPANCGVLTDAAVAANILPGTGGLAGTATVINVAAGTDYGYNPTALGAFSATSLFATPGSVLPNVGSVNPKVSHVMYGTGVVASCWDGLTGSCNTTATLGAVAADPVSAVLMHSNVINEFVLDTATLSGTDWVVTMPTKSANNGGYVSNDTLTATGVRTNAAAIRPFQRQFWTGGSCDDVTISIYDREEAVTNQVMFSPQPQQTTSVCWEANVITFNNSNNLGSTNNLNVPTGYQNGWMQLAFPTVASYPAAHRMQSGVGVGYAQATYFGLPTVGFMVQDFVNGNVGGVLSNYGGNFDHKGNRNITMP